MTRLMLAAVLSMVLTGGYAQEYPSKPITIIVPNPPGGMNQIHAQPLSAVIEKIVKQPAPVINKPGATAAVGTAYVANQAPDGYNLLVTTPNLYLVIEKDRLYGIKSPYTLDQIAPLALLSADPLTMVVQAQSPYKSVKDLVDAAKAKQGAMSFSSSGPYGITHVPMAMFMGAADIKMRHVPTTGGGPAVIQLLGGHVDVTDAGPAGVYPHVAAGKLRALATWGVRPYPSFPNVPTLKQLGYDVEAYLWVGLFTTAGVPETTFNKMREMIRKVADDPLFKQALEKAQVVPDYRDAPEFKKFFDADYKRMAVAVKKIGKL